MLRGDDVAELQQRLCTLGFDTGRVDGIFGDATVRALGEFQRNAGLPVDGIVAAPPCASCCASRAATTSPSWSRPCGPGPRCATPRPPCGAATSPSARAAGLGSVTGALRRRLTLAAASGSPSCTTPTTPCRPRRPTSSRSTSSSGCGSIPRPRSCRTAFWSGRPRRVARRAPAGRAGPGRGPRGAGRRRRRRPRHVGAPPARDPHARSADRGGPASTRGRAGARAGRRPRRRARPLGRRLLGLITGNHNARSRPPAASVWHPRGPGDGYAINASGR